MLITSIKSDLKRVSDLAGGNFTTLAIDELQIFFQGYEFETPVINMYPINSATSEINESGRVAWSVSVEIDFLTKIEVNSTENEKDIIIDQMIDLSEVFTRELHANRNRVFENPTLSLRNNVIRFKTSNYCVGVGLSFNLLTSCNRIK